MCKIQPEKKTLLDIDYAQLHVHPYLFTKASYRTITRQNSTDALSHISQFQVNNVNFYSKMEPKKWAILYNSQGFVQLSNVHKDP